MQFIQNGPAADPGAGAVRDRAGNPVPFSVCFVCSGNICRSPIAEVVLRDLVHRAGLDDVVAVDSAGTGDWHIGEGADRRAVQALAEAGLDGATHRARQFDPAWFDHRTHVVALDHGHLRTLRSWAPHAPARERVRLLRSYDPQAAAAFAASGAAHEIDVADPYYDDLEAFRDVLQQVTAACQGLLDDITSGTGSTSPV